LPPQELVTAAFCLAITEGEEIILARSKRGWGMLGGHAKDGESIEDALTIKSLTDEALTS